jgi:hypothetical protein
MRFRLYHLLLMCCAGPLAQAQGMVATEAALQAALLYNFAAYTEWPSLPVEKIELCVMDSETVHEALTKLQNKTIKGRALEVRAITTTAQAKSCQLLFVGREGHNKIPELSQGAHPSPLLLVAEEDGYELSNVIVSLRLQNNRFTFKINQSAALRNSLKFNARLLKLAALVY